MEQTLGQRVAALEKKMTIAGNVNIALGIGFLVVAFYLYKNT